MDGELKDQVIHLFKIAQLDEANTFKERGNVHFRNGKYDKAIKLYKKMNSAILFNSFDSEAEEKQRKALLVIGYLNLAMCQIKLDLFTACRVSCNKALEIDSKSVKGLFRRGQANLSLGEAANAKLDFEAVMQIEPNNTAAPNQIIACDKKLQELCGKEKELYTNMFKHMGQGDSEAPSTQCYQRDIYQFKITLDDYKPSIWRRIQIPGHCNFRDLHLAIQDSMGWFNCHMHRFIIKNAKTNQSIVIARKEKNNCHWLGQSVDSVMYSAFGGDKIKMINEKRVYIHDVFSMKNGEGRYEYDFGDNWDHIIKLEKIVARPKWISFPRCIAGKRACPPEDAGGTRGYARILRILANKKHGEYDHLKEWMINTVGPQFDPKRFNHYNVTMNTSEVVSDDNETDDDSSKAIGETWEAGNTSKDSWETEEDWKTGEEDDNE